MRITYSNRHAYTLAEIMVVLLIVTIIFAAFAPLFTGRMKKNYRSIYDVWSWANLTTFDAFASSNVPQNTNQLIFGATPNDGTEINTVYSPLSKVIIRSGNVTQTAKTQRQIQFRYGRTNSSDDPGRYAGTWLVDGSNYLLGGEYYDLVETSALKARNNTAIGYNALTSLKESNNNTAIGYNALAKLSTSTKGNNVAIGYYAGYNNQNSKGRNTFAGSNAGANTTGYNNVAVGYNAMNLGSGAGYNNSFVGAYSGSSATSARNNVAVGYNALNQITTGSNNVAIGYNALSKLTTGSNNVAIGYNACSEVTTGSNKTCIGYNSGPRTGTNMNASNFSEAAFLKGYEDDAYRTYIGSKPHNFGGDAVLEIHNLRSSSNPMPGISTSSFNTTTIINGNLIVRGRPYFTIGNALNHFYDYDSSGKMKIDGNIYYYGYTGSGDASYYANCSSSPSTYYFNSNCITLSTKGPTSDRRLKNIDGKFTAGMDKLRNINVYNYTFKDDKNKLPHVGVIAQELQRVFPTAVFKGEDGYLRIRWDEMFYAMINGIKEIDKRIISLVTRTKNVESQISQLEKENSHLKKQVENLTVRINKIKAQ